MDVLELTREHIVVDGGSEGLPLELICKDKLSLKDQILPILLKDGFVMSEGKVSAPDWLRLAFYAQGRYLNVSELAIKILDSVAKTRKEGITQLELTKSLNLDPRNTFYYLKSLYETKVLVKQPFVQNKFFTHLIHLARFLPAPGIESSPEENEETNEKFETNPDDDLSNIRKQITDLLSQSPANSLPWSEIYDYFKPKKNHQSVKRALHWLEKHKYILISPSNSDNEPKGSRTNSGNPHQCTLLKSIIPTSLRTTIKVTPVNSVSNNFSKNSSHLELMTGFKLKRFGSFDSQIHDWILESGSKGVTLSEIMKAFAIDRKIAYRIIDRLAKPLNKAVGLFSNSDIVRVSEFEGKERRIRIFSKSALVEDSGQLEKNNFKSENTESSLGTCISSPSPSIESPSTHEPLSEFRSIDITSKPDECDFIQPFSQINSHQNPPSSFLPTILEVIQTMEKHASNSNSRRVSFTQEKRIKAFMRILDREKFYEIGKPLGELIQKECGETQYLIDIKTIKRIINHLESEGKVRIIRICPPGPIQQQLKTFVALPTVEDNDPLILDYINRMQKLENVFGSTDTMSNVNLEMSMTRSSVEEKSNLYRRIPHVYGVLVRVKILHIWLIKFAFNSCIIDSDKLGFDLKRGIPVDTIDALFRLLPLGLYLRLVGITSITTGLASFFNDPVNEEIPLSKIPAKFLPEIHQQRRVARHKHLMKILIGHLVSMGLISPLYKHAQSLSSLPSHYVVKVSILSPIDHLRQPPDPHHIILGPSVNAASGKAQQDAEDFWKLLESNPYQALQKIFIKDPITREKFIEMASMKTCWLYASPFAVDIRKSLKMLKKRLDTVGQIKDPERESLIVEFATQHDIDVDRVREAVGKLTRKLRFEAPEDDYDETGQLQDPRQHKKSKRLKNSTDDNSHGFNTTDTQGSSGICKMLPLHRDKVLLCLILLHDCRFQTLTPKKVDWSLAESLNHHKLHPKDENGTPLYIWIPEELRHLRLSSSFNEIYAQNVLSIESAMNVLRQSNSLSQIDDNDAKINPDFAQTYYEFHHLLFDPTEGFNVIESRSKLITTQLLQGKPIESVKLIPFRPEKTIFSIQNSTKAQVGRFNQSYYHTSLPSSQLNLAEDQKKEHSINEEAAVNDTETIRTMQIIKRIFSSNPDNFGHAFIILESLDRLVLEKSLARLESEGLIAKTHRMPSRFVQKIPNGEWAISDVFNNLLTKDSRLSLTNRSFSRSPTPIDAFKLSFTLQSSTRNILPLLYGIKMGLVGCEVDFEKCTCSVATRVERFPDLLELMKQQKLDHDLLPLWIPISTPPPRDTSSNFHQNTPSSPEPDSRIVYEPEIDETIATNCILLIFNKIRCSPGISRERLANVLNPLLFRFELNLLIDAMLHSKMIELELENLFTVCQINT